MSSKWCPSQRQRLSTAANGTATFSALCRSRAPHGRCDGTSSVRVRASPTPSTERTRATASDRIQTSASLLYFLPAPLDCERIRMRSAVEGTSPSAARTVSAALTAAANLSAVNALRCTTKTSWGVRPGSRLRKMSAPPSGTESTTAIMRGTLANSGGADCAERFTAHDSSRRALTATSGARTTNLRKVRVECCPSRLRGALTHTRCLRQLSDTATSRSGRSRPQ